MTSRSEYNNSIQNAPTAPTARAAQRPLVTYANRGADAGQAANPQRDARYKMLNTLWQVSDLDRVRNCRRVAVGPSGTVEVRHSSEGVAGYSGLATCGSIWACPVCSTRIQAGRREELQLLVDWADANGFTVLFGTMTLRHHRNQALGQVWGALGDCFKAVRTNGSVRKIRDELGFDGYVRAVEVTHSPQNGWHPHIHQLYLLKRSTITDEQMEVLGDVEFAAWKKAAVKAGLGEPVRKRYQLERVSGDIADYMAKDDDIRPSSSAAYELAGSATKVGRKTSRTPFQILADFSETGNADDFDLWNEYERVSKGKRALTWSQGLKDRAGVTERSDDEIVEEEIGDKEDTIFAIAEWQRDMSPRPVLISQLLTAVENGGRVGGLRFCREHQIEVLAPDHERVRSDRKAARKLYGWEEPDGAAARLRDAGNEFLAAMVAATSATPSAA